MGSKDEKPASGGFFSAITSSVRNWGSAVHKSVNGCEFLFLPKDRSFLTPIDMKAT